MAQFGIVCLDRIGLAFVAHGVVLTGVIDQPRIDTEGIAEVARCLWAAIEHGLQSGFGSFPQHGPAHNAAAEPVDLRYDKDCVFFEPTKVNSSSSSFTCSGSVGPGGMARNSSRRALAPVDN